MTLRRRRDADEQYWAEERRKAERLPTRAEALEAIREGGDRQAAIQRMKKHAAELERGHRSGRIGSAEYKKARHQIAAIARIAGLPDPFVSKMRRDPARRRTRTLNVKRRAPLKKRSAAHGTRKRNFKKQNYYLLYWEGGRGGWRIHPKEAHGPFVSRAAAALAMGHDRAKWGMPRNRYQIVTEPTKIRLWGA